MSCFGQITWPSWVSSSHDEWSLGQIPSVGWCSAGNWLQENEVNSVADGCLGPRRWFSLCALICVAGGLLVSCTNPPSAQLESVDQVDMTAKTPRKITNRGDGSALAAKSGQPRYEFFPGVSDRLLDDGEEPPPGVGAEQDGKFTVNVDQASIAEAAKLILGETIGYNYVLDPRVQGNVTMVSNRPLTTS